MCLLHWTDGASTTMVTLERLQVCLFKLSCLFFLIKLILIIFPNFFVRCYFFSDWINKDWEREVMTLGCTPCTERHTSANIASAIVVSSNCQGCFYRNKILTCLYKGGESQQFSLLKFIYVSQSGIRLKGFFKLFHLSFMYKNFLLEYYLWVKDVVF